MKFIQQQMKRTDCTYIGSSAGAMIAGTDIYLAEDFDENIVGLTDLKALGLFDGSVIPHYSRRDLKRYTKIRIRKISGVTVNCIQWMTMKR